MIRFTRRIARQCSQGDGRVADWAVCDTIINGSRRATGRRGSSGGPIVRFAKAFPLGAAARPPPDRRKAMVVVLGELVRHGCIALRLLRPAGARDKIWDEAGFLHRADSK